MDRRIDRSPSLTPLLLLVTLLLAGTGLALVCYLDEVEAARSASPLEPSSPLRPELPGERAVRQLEGGPPSFPSG